MGLQRYLGFPKSPSSPLSQCVLATESVTTPAPGHTGALLDLGLQEGFSHGKSSSVLAQPRGLVVLLQQPGPCMDSREQLSQLIVAHGCRGERTRGSHCPGWCCQPCSCWHEGTALSSADLPNSWPQTGLESKTFEPLGEHELSCVWCVEHPPVPRFLHDGQHHPAPWLSLHLLLLSRGDGHLLPRCHVKIRRKACSCAPSLCPAPAAPWEGSTLCHAGWILLSLHGTTARNKGLSSAITHRCPGSGPWGVGLGMRAWGWHRDRGIHPYA